MDRLISFLALALPSAGYGGKQANNYDSLHYCYEQVGHGIFMEYGVCEPLYRFGSYCPSEDVMSILESDEKR